MKKRNIVKENKEFNRIIINTKPYKSKSFIIYLEKNTNIDCYKFGISVGKKIGNAVIRNKLKRQIRNIIDKNDYQNQFKCIIILKKRILDLCYDEIENELIENFKKLEIIKENDDEKKDY